MTLLFNETGLIVRFTLAETLLGLHGDFSIPAKNVSYAWPGMPQSTWNEWRIPGSFIPGLIKAGSYYTPRGREFWYVTKNKHYAVTIELNGHNPYDRLVLGFEDPSSITTSGLRLSGPPGTFDIQD